MPLVEMSVEETLDWMEYTKTDKLEPAPGCYVRTHKMQHIEEILDVFDKANGRKVYIYSIARVDFPNIAKCYLLRFCYGKEGDVQVVC